MCIRDSCSTSATGRDTAHDASFKRPAPLSTSVGCPLSSRETGHRPELGRTCSSPIPGLMGGVVIQGWARRRDPVQNLGSLASSK
eukprot:10393403-Alexandrium_andersonii.AAC.1